MTVLVSDTADGAPLASSILNRVRIQLIDTGTERRWTDVELLYWLSDGQRAIVAALPHAAYRVSIINLVGGTRQVLPDDAYRLLDIVRNQTNSGVPGAPCTSIDRAILDRQYLDWHTGASQPSALHWTYNPVDPQAFYVFPRNDGTGSLEVVYSYMPSDVLSTTDQINIRPIYQTPLVDYVMFRAHSKDSDFAAGQAVAASYLQAFTAFLQAQTGGQQ